jgi:molecular chaperone HtpG
MVEQMTEKSATETFGFQAEVKQLLHLMVHSLYSDREIFLRELISNASDANDRLRFESLANPDLLDDSELEIRVSIDPNESYLTVTDNGIGMSREEIVEQLGTIAHSGTSRLLEQMTTEERTASQLIGQFGVGFYSAFIVAEEVEVSSRRAGDAESEGVRWVSDGQGEYSVERVTRASRGTAVRLKMKKDAKEFLDPDRVRALVRKYSDHISFPVRMADPEGTGDVETINHAQALWTRPRSEISDDEYVEFYRHITHDFAEPLIWSHNSVEGKREYTSLLYIPSAAPFDIWNRESPRGVKLYVQRVFITDQATQFLPLYLRFVRGVVDSRDLSLNVSREVLQQDPNVAAIRRALTKRVLDMLARLIKEDSEKYATFWSQFGGVLKEGLAEDAGHRDQLAGLLRFASTASGGDKQDRGLGDYIAAAGEEQDVIYYLLAESPSVARASPHLEVFREKGIEVLFLTDRIDEWVVQHLREFDGKPLRDITRGELDLEESGENDQKKSDTEKDQCHNELTRRVKDILADRVADVRVSGRLRRSAACLVLADQDIGFQMREMLKAAGHELPASVASLELNPAHPLVMRLAKETDDERFERLSLIVLDQAMIAEGRQLDDPAAYLVRLDEFLGDLGLERRDEENPVQG